MQTPPSSTNHSESGRSQPRPTAPDPSATRRPAQSPSTTKIDRRIIAVDRPEGSVGRLRSILQRSNLEVYWPPRPETAIALCRKKRFDLVFVSVPLIDRPLSRFVEALRAGLSPSSQPTVVAIALASDCDAVRHLTDSKLKVISATRTQSELERIALDEIDQPRRAAIRLFARLEGRLGTEKILRMCQTINISESGVLVTTDHLAPTGTRLRLELNVEPERAPLQLEVEIVRHARPEVEGVRGLGLRFVGFRGDDEARLQRFLAQPKLWV